MQLYQLRAPSKPWRLSLDAAKHCPTIWRESWVFYIAWTLNVMLIWIQYSMMSLVVTKVKSFLSWFPKNFRSWISYCAISCLIFLHQLFVLMWLPIWMFCRYNGVEGLHIKVTEFVKDKDCLVCGPGVLIELETSVTLRKVLIPPPGPSYLSWIICCSFQVGFCELVRTFA